MREFQEKKRIRRYIYSPITLIVLLGVLYVVGRATWNVSLKQNDSETKKDQTQGRYEQLVSHRDALEASVAKLKTDEGVEQEIRDKFRMAKDGEQLIVIIDDKAKEGEGATAKTGFKSWMGTMWANVVEAFR